MRRIGAMLEFRVSRIPWPFPATTSAFTIWPVIVYQQAVWDDQCLQAHERYHWKDQARWLVIPWLLVYLVLRPFYGGGRKHPLERPAYAVEDACRSANPR